MKAFIFIFFTASSKHSHCDSIVVDVIRLWSPLLFLFTQLLSNALFVSKEMVSNPNQIFCFISSLTFFSIKSGGKIDSASYSSDSSRQFRQVSVYLTSHHRSLYINVLYINFTILFHPGLYIVCVCGLFIMKKNNNSNHQKLFSFIDWYIYIYIYKYIHSLECIFYVQLSA